MVWQNGLDYDGYVLQGGFDVYYQGDYDQCGLDCDGYDKCDLVCYEQDYFVWCGNDFCKGYLVLVLFCGDEYCVCDWSDCGLLFLLEGYYWFYIDGNYVLIVVVIGIIILILVSGVFGY